MGHPTCSVRVYGGSFRGHLCGKKGKAQGPNGAWFCGVHDPAAVARRDAKNREAWEQKNVVWRREQLAKRLGLMCLDAGFDTSEKLAALFERGAGTDTGVLR